MATERFSLLLESRTTGTEELSKLEQALRRVSEVAEQSSKRTSSAVKSQADNFSNSLGSIKGVLENPFAAATKGAEDFALSFGKVGLAAAGTVATVAAVGAALFTVAKRTGELAEAQGNAAQILGLSIKDYGLFSQVAENAGVDASLLTATMRGLSKALSDQDDEGKKAKRALSELGVASTDVFGSVRPTKELLLDIADALGGIESPAARADAAIKILGKGGIGLIPILNKELRGSVEEMRRLGVGFDEVSSKTAQNFDNALDRMTTRLKTFIKDLGVGVAEAAGFADPEKVKADAAQRARERAANFEFYNATRSGKTLEIGTADLFSATARARSIGGVTDDQLTAQKKLSNKTQIIDLLETQDIEAKIGAARKQLETAVQDNDIVAVRTELAHIKSLEEQKKAADKAKELAERLKKVAEEGRKLAREALADARLQEQGVDTSKLTEAEKKLIETNADSTITGESRRLLRGGLAAKAAVERRALRDKEEREIMQLMTAANFAAVDNPVDQYNPLKGFMGANKYPVLAGYEDLISNTRTSGQQAIERVGFNTQPGNEMRVVNQQIAMRLDLRKQEYDLQVANANLMADDMERERAKVALGQQYNRDVLDIRFEKERAIADLKQKQREEGRNTFTSLFDAAVAGGQGLRSFVTSTALSVPRTVAGNLGGLFGGLTGRFTLPGASSDNLVGKLLAGTPFGVDPLKQAGDIQLDAAKLQLQAATIQAGRGGGGGGVLASLPASVAKYFGSGTSSFISGTGSAPDLGITDAYGNVLPNIGSNTGYQPYAGPDGTVLTRIPSVGTSALSKGIGGAALIAGGAATAYSGFSAGGAQGALTGSSGILGATSGLLALAGVSGPAAPIIGGIALALGAVSLLMGDPKKRRAAALDSEAKSRSFTEPTGTDYVSDQYGRSIGYDYLGTPRPIQNIYVTNQIDTTDPRSFSQYLKDNPEALAEGISSAIMGGNGDDIRGALRLTNA